MVSSISTSTLQGTQPPAAECIKKGKEASVILRENSSSWKPVMVKHYGILPLSVIVAILYMKNQVHWVEK